jgi:hypothetical protein
VYDMQTASQPDSPELNEETGDDAALAYLAKARTAAEAGGEVEQEETEEGLEAQPDPTAAQTEEDALAWLKKTHKISIDGVEKEITAEEAFKGYQFEAYSRQQTERAAQLTRQAEQDRQAVQREREYHANQLDVLAHALHTELVGDESKLLELLETDPVGYLRMKEHIGQKKETIAQAIQQRQQLAELSAQEQAQQYDAYVADEQKKLQQALPEWRDAKVRDAEAAAIGDYLRGRGYATDEMNMLTDHRALLIARDAMRWQKLQEIKGKQSATPSKPVPSGTRNSPNGAPNPKAAELLARARRTGSTEDQLAYMASKRAPNRG